MSAPYDMNLNITSFRDLYIAANTFSSNIYVPLAVLSVLIIAFVTLYTKGNPAPQSAAAAGFIATLFSVLLWVSGVATTAVVGSAFAIMLAAVLWTFLS